MANFSKSNAPQFSVDVYQNEYLPEGGREVNAIVTVTATGGGTTKSAVAAPRPYASGAAPDAAVAVMVDCSGSMDYPPTKMRNARDATAAAIDTLRDGVHFAVIGGTHVAKEVYPGGGRLAVADARTRDQAKQALRKLSAGAAPRSAPGCASPTGCCPRRTCRYGTASCSPTAATNTSRPRTSGPHSMPVPDVSPVTRVESAPTGRSRRSPGSRPRCSAPPTSSPTRPPCPRTSRG
ncbi:hypothetical protein SAVCW2_25260 [Streptomyces avermitilis]|nr:hypothetical protein SAVCW2_25260 [Streptomyces avermitilis]